MSVTNIANADGADNRNFSRCAYCDEGKTVQMWAIMGDRCPTALRLRAGLLPHM
jgi:hypothetical protein